MIPKAIYYCWFGSNQIPPQQQKFINEWAIIMPDYSIVKITEKDLPDNNFTRQSLEKKDYCSLSNYMRVKMLYEKGGIYLDTDMQVVKPFDELLDNKVVLCAEDNWVVNCAAILSMPKQQFLKDCIDWLESYLFDLTDHELETGPRLATRVAKQYGWSFAKTGTFNDVVIMQPRHFYPYHYTESFTPECVTKDTFAIHHWGHTWNNKVSIVIPCYNQAQYLPDAIESAIAQTYTNIEIIIVNDGSTDNTSEVAKKYIASDSRVKLIEQSNKGLSAARNSGIKSSNGGWIATLDADDKLHETFIEKTIKQGDVVSTYLQTFGNENKLWQSRSINPTDKDFQKNNQIHCCSLFKKEAWQTVSGYDEQMKDGFEDWEFWYRIAKAGYFFNVIKEPLFFYRKRGESMLTEAFRKQKQILEYCSRKHNVKFGE